MLSISIYSTIGFCLVGYLLSEVVSLNYILDRADKPPGLDTFVPAILPLATSSGQYAPMRHPAYTWTSDTQNATTLSSPPSTSAEKGLATDGGDHKPRRSRSESRRNAAMRKSGSAATIVVEENGARWLKSWDAKAYDLSDYLLVHIADKEHRSLKTTTY